MLLKFVQIGLAVTILSLLSACQNEEQPKKLKKASITESKLYKINMSVALIKSNIDINKNINCMLSARVEDKPIQNQDSKAGSLIREMQQENENLCNFFTTTLNIVSPVFEAIENTGSIPKESFVLTIISYSYNKEHQKIYEEDIIGLFRSLDNCESVKGLAQKLNIPNKGCKKWDEKEF